MFIFLTIFFIVSCGNSPSFTVGEGNSHLGFSSTSKNEEAFAAKDVASEELEDSEDSEEDIVAEIPVVIAGSYLHCQVLDSDNPNKLSCKYTGVGSIFVEGIVLLSEDGVEIRIDKIDPASKTVVVEVIGEKPITPLPSLDESLVADQKQSGNEINDDDTGELSQVEPSEVSQTESATFTSLPFNLLMSYIDYPFYNFDNNTGFRGDIDVLTYLSGGDISLSCEKKSDGSLLFSSNQQRIRRDPNKILTHLLDVDFLEGDSTLSLSDLDDVVCEVSANFPSSLEEDLGFEIERGQEGKADFYGTVTLTKEGIDLSSINPKSFSSNIDCIYVGNDSGVCSVED